MADFIYLLQNRLTPAQWRALGAVREAARAHSMPVFLVGGAVRDLTTGSPVRDLDFSVQGDAAALIPDLEAAGATVTGRNSVLSSVYLSFAGGVRAELGPSVTVTYPKPGQPEAQPAPILDDLRRRDFTANAMAVSLNEGSYGLLLDPLNGTADIENRELRLVSPYGFIEQPALLLRAARLGERLGWSMEERTAARYGTSKEEGHIEALPAADRGYEMEEVLHEEDPFSALEYLESQGWAEVLFPALRSGDADRAGMDAVREMIGQLEGQGIHPDPSAVYFPLLTAKLSEKDRSALKNMLVRPGFVQQVETIEARARELASQLTSRAAALPSESWRLLKNAEPDLVLWLAFHMRSGAVQTKIKAFLKDWPQMRQKIPYALMQEMRITPDLPGYDKLLEDLFFALMDGKLDTPEATRAFLEPFSPPAPPQVTVRRRPAKAARGRAKRVVEEIPADVADEPDTDDQEDTEAEDTLDDDISEDREEDDEDTSAPTKDRGEDAEDSDDDREDEDEDDEDQRPRVAAKTKSAAKTATPAKVASAPAKSVPAKATPVAVPATSAPEKRTAPAKSVAAADNAAVQAPAPGAAKKGVAKQAAPAKATAAPKAAPAPQVVPAKATAAKTPAKLATKAAPLKSAGKAPAVAEVKLPAKKGAAKATPPPAKAVPAKGAKKTIIVVKVPAKKQAVKAPPPAALKKSAPTKAAKKAPAKRGR